MPDDLGFAARAAGIEVSVFEGPAVRIDPGVPGAVLRALADMARRSRRNQADLDVALHRAGLRLTRDEQGAALRQLSDVASVGEVIELEDGGVLLTVTSAGMERAARC